MISGGSPVFVSSYSVDSNTNNVDGIQICWHSEAMESRDQSCRLVTRAGIGLSLYQLQTSTSIASLSILIISHHQYNDRRHLLSNLISMLDRTWSSRHRYADTKTNTLRGSNVIMGEKVVWKKWIAQCVLQQKNNSNFFKHFWRILLIRYVHLYHISFDDRLRSRKCGRCGYTMVWKTKGWWLTSHVVLRQIDIKLIPSHVVIIQMDQALVPILYSQENIPLQPFRNCPYNYRWSMRVDCDRGMQIPFDTCSRLAMCNKWVLMQRRMSLGSVSDAAPDLSAFLTSHGAVK